MALISHRNRYVFIHIPRTGGTSFRKYNQDNIDVELSLHATIEDVMNKGYICLDYEWKTIVRNPFDRAVSYYELKRTDPNYTWSFKRYLNEDQWLTPQVKFLRPIEGYPINLTIMRFEVVFKDNTEFQKGLPHENKSIRKPYIEYYDEDDIKVATDRYEIDLKSLGYEWK